MSFFTRNPDEYVNARLIRRAGTEARSYAPPVAYVPHPDDEAPDAAPLRVEGPCDGCPADAVSLLARIALHPHPQPGWEKKFQAATVGLLALCGHHTDRLLTGDTADEWIEVASLPRFPAGT